MLAALKNVPPTSFTPIDSARFEGCSQDCRPAPPPRNGDGIQEADPEDEEGAIGDADLGDGGGGPRG